MGNACWPSIYDSECNSICSKPLYLCKHNLHMGTKAVKMTMTWKITTLIFIWFTCTLRYWQTNYFNCKLTNNCCSIAHINSSHTIWTGGYHDFMYKPSIQLVLPYGPSTWGQHLCQSLFSCICISWDMQRSVVMCSEYYMRTDLGHNLTRMDRCTAISEYSNFPNTSFENLHPSMVLVFIYCTDNSNTDEVYKQYSNILYTSYIKKILIKNCRYTRLYFVLCFLCTLLKDCLKIAIHNFVFTPSSTFRKSTVHYFIL